MTLENNRAPLLCYFKLCASFRSHWWIQTGVTVWKHPIWFKFDDFFSRVTLKFDGWPCKTIGHLFYATSSFVHHFVAIGEFKLEFTVAVFTIFATSNVDSIVGIPHKIYSKNFNPHKKLISLLNVPICTQGMQRTWWPEAGTIIVTEPYLSSVILPPFSPREMRFIVYQKRISSKLRGV